MGARQPVTASDARALLAAPSASARQQAAPRVRPGPPVTASDAWALPAAQSSPALQQAAPRAGPGPPVTVSDALALPAEQSSPARQQDTLRAEAAPAPRAGPGRLSLSLTRVLRPPHRVLLRDSKTLDVQRRRR